MTDLYYTSSEIGGVMLPSSNYVIFNLRKYIICTTKQNLNDKIIFRTCKKVDTFFVGVVKPIVFPLILK